MDINCPHSEVAFVRRVFVNRTHHLCVQCKQCGRVVKNGEKAWLLPSDIPKDATIEEFDEALYRGEDKRQAGLF